MRVLAINPGATSTKIGVFDSRVEIMATTIEHHGSDLAGFKSILDQYHYRLELIKRTLTEGGIELNSIQGTVGRGGLLKPLEGGTYVVDKKMLKDLKETKRGEHASNLGGMLAYGIVEGKPAYIVDPVSVDEFENVARISGLVDLPRISMSHALNSKAVARKVAIDLNKKYSEMNMIVAHLGTGVSVSAHKKGRMIDVNNAQEEGPFSPDRCGTVPARSLVKFCYSGKYSEQEMVKRISGSGGIYGYLGTKDLREVIRMAEEGNETASILLEAMPYQIAKQIGAMATVLSGEVECIVLTGGMAYSKLIVQAISMRTQFIAPIIVEPGEEELESLALGALRVLTGEEKPLYY